MRSTRLVLALGSSACGPDEGRDPGDTVTTPPATDPGATSTGTRATSGAQAT